MIYVLLPRIPVGETLKLRGYKRADARGMLAKVDPDVADTIARSLVRLGMEAQDRETEGLAPNQFARLPYLQVFVASVESNDRAQEIAQAIDYVAVPSIQLSLVEPAAAEPEQLPSPPTPPWPDESGVDVAHERGFHGQGVLVGVLDTGCDADHAEHLSQIVNFRHFRPDLRGSRSKRGFDPAGHGTHVCGIIRGANLGVAPEVDLYVGSVLESGTVRTDLERVLAGLDWLIEEFAEPDNQDRPAVVNMSLGFRPEWFLPSDWQNISIAMRQMFQFLAEDLDVLPVVAAGNDGDGEVRAPGSFPEALAVGAIDFSGTSVPHFSSGGQSLDGSPKPDLVGYGVGLVSSYERDCLGNNLYQRLDGTSMAAAYVTGLAALYASADPGSGGRDLRTRLLSTARRLGFPSNRVGKGVARFVP